MTIHNSLNIKYESLPKRRGHFIISPTNTGKTTAAISKFFKGGTYYIKDLSTVTVDGY